MAWSYLGLAAIFEVTFAMSMNYANVLTNVKASVITAVAVIAGIGFLTLALRNLLVSVAYPIWTAVGTLGTVALGYTFLREALTPLKVISALTIVVGVAGLKISAD